MTRLPSPWAWMLAALMAGLASCSGASDPRVPAVAPTDGLLSRDGACGVLGFAGPAHAASFRTAGIGTATADTALFDIGSVAKTFTAAAVLALAEDGRLEITAPIARYLPDVPVDKRQLTVAELLEHVSGLPQDYSSDQSDLTRQEAELRILKLRLGQVGTFAYSNAGYTLLAAIVERVAHEPFERFVETRLWTRAGMHSTGWYGPPPQGTVPVHGNVGRDTGTAGTQAPHSWATLGAGGITSTAPDMLRWVEALNRGRVLGPIELSAMFAPRVGLGQPGLMVAFGWIVGDSRQGRPVRLAGGMTDFGYTSDVRYYPKTGVATVALACSTAIDARSLGDTLEGAGNRS